MGSVEREPPDPHSHSSVNETIKYPARGPNPPNIVMQRPELIPNMPDTNTESSVPSVSPSDTFSFPNQHERSIAENTSEEAQRSFLMVIDQPPTLVYRANRWLRLNTFLPSQGKCPNCQGDFQIVYGELKISDEYGDRQRAAW